MANSISENNGLKLHLKQCITHEQEQALHKIEALELALHKKDMDLKNAHSTLEKLQAKVEQKHLELENYNHQLNATSSKVTPAQTPKDTPPCR